MHRRTTYVSEHPRKKPTGGYTTVSFHSRSIKDVPTMRRNKERNGIELRFESKPSKEIRDLLKRKGFRGSNRYGIWYTRYSAEKEQFAKMLSEGQIESVPQASTKSFAKQKSEKRSFKYLGVPTGKRKPKSIGKSTIESYLKARPEFVDRVWDKVYKYPAEWSAEEARKRIKTGHPDAKLIAGAKVSGVSYANVPRMTRRINEVHSQYPPSLYRVTIMDRTGNRYKMGYDRQLRKITAPGLTETQVTPLERLVNQGRVGIQVQAWDDSDFSRGKNIRGIGRTILTEEL